MTGELRAPNGLGAVAERLRRVAPPGPRLKASVPGPYTLAGRLVPNADYPDRWALAEAPLPIVGGERVALAEVQNLDGAGLAVPMHVEMFAFNTAPPDLFTADCERLGQPYRVLRAGERLDL